MNKLRLGFGLMVSFAASASCIAGDLVKPEAGMWEQSTLVSADGKSWRPGVKNKGCMTEAQANAWESQVRQQIAAASCTINSLSVAGGQISGVISCTSINQPVVSINGQYNGSSYSVDLASSAVVDMSQVGGPAKAPVKSFAKWTGRHVGPC